MNVNDLYENLSISKAHWKTEEEVRKDWLKNFENALNICFHAERQRNDASYNQVIIEFKNKGLFNSSENSSKYKEAIYERLKPYILKRSKDEGIEESSYTGIATDGDHIVFAYIKDREIYPRSLMPFSLSSIEKVYLALQESTRPALVEENLIEDFGHDSEIAINLMTALSNELEIHLNANKNNKIKMLFEEWKTLFGQVSRLSITQVSQIKKTTKFKSPNIKNEEIPGILFIIHTYNALLLKLLGAEILSHFHGLTQYKDFCEYLSYQEDSDLINYLYLDIEKSNFFSKAGVKGFVEEAIFSWYLDAALEDDKKKILEALRKILIKLSLYQMDNLDTIRSRDVLKRLYQSLIPDTLRKSLGEFYTPDWLIEVAVKKSETKNWLDVRVLDPTCGSGSFLLNVIEKKKAQALKKGWASEKILDHILTTVWGFDLNPLAVQSARVNFLIAISDLFEQCKGKKIELPILLADSVYSPARNPKSDENVVEYIIGSSYANLLIQLPAELAFNRKLLDSVFYIFELAVEEEKDYSYVSAEIVKRGITNTEKNKAWYPILEATYNRVLDLHKKNWNSLWFRIVRNFFWSATAGQFDLIVGNPPWVRWSNLPEEYRNRIKPTCEMYEIFSETPYHGGNELDISGMITYTVADKWLKEQGKLVFILTQTHFQSPSSQGFRSFAINDVFSLIPLEVDDLKSLKPFSGVANKTSVAIFKKMKKQEVEYPVKYNIWNTIQGYSRTIPENLESNEIDKRFQIMPMEAHPVADIRSPWAIMDKDRFKLTSAIRGKSTWLQGRKGVTTDLNAIYMVAIVDENPKQNLLKIKIDPNLGRNTKHLISKEYWVEPDLIYPMIKGAADFEACFLRPLKNLYIIVPNFGINKDKLLEAQEKMNYHLPELFDYFKEYKDLLSKRSTYKSRLNKYDFYTIYNVGEYTFSPYKVIWAEQSGRFESAVVTGKKVPIVGYRPYVPDHKIYFADFANEEEAYFLCGLLNTPLVSQFIESHTISIQVSNIFKHLNLPKYDDVNSIHNDLAVLTQRIHNEHNKDERIRLLNELYVIGEKILL